MARRNVDLVISAKDEAEKVLRQITAALDDFTASSRGTSTGAEKTEGSLAKLGVAISKLQKDLGGLEVAEKLGGELRKAEKELSRLDAQFDQTSAEAAQLGKRLDQTGAQAERFASKLQGAKAALDRQKGAIRDAKVNQRELAAAYAQAEAAQAKLTARQAQLPALIERQTAALDKAKQRYQELAARIESTVEPSKTLQTQFDASARAVDQNVAKLAKLSTEYSDIAGQVRAAGSAMTIFATQSQQAAANVAKQERVLAKIEDNLVGVKAQAAAAGGEQSRLAGKFAQATQSLAQQQQVIDRAESNYVDLAQAAGRADAALESLSAQSLGRLAQELKNQRRETLSAKREYVELSQAATQLATNIGRVGVPTREMAEQFARTVVAAGRAKTEYQEQRVALELMGRAYREVGTDISSINGVQGRFQAILAQTSANLSQNAAAAQKADRALDGLYQASNRVTGSLSGVSSGATRVASANERAATATGRLAAAYREFYGDTRRSLSLLQRIRGEVLSLVAAYGGLFGVISVLQGTVKAYEQLEAAQSRLTVAVGGDQAAATQELDFLRRTADRLGVSFGVLSQEYSKFAIATKGTRLEGAATREIFVSVAEAARVNRSSTEEMAGVFTALTQIVSKGAVQMEELRQQLGDRLPGALQLMADGIGVTTAELIKMLEQGEVTSDALLPFARELTERFGPGLAQALTSTSTAIGRLGNEAFEALLRFGQAGFLEAFTELAQTITTTLQSADFQTFSDNASAAISKLVNFISFAVENFDVLAAAITAFLALRLTPVVLAVAAGFRDFGRDILSAAVATKAAGAAASGATGRIAAMGVAVSRLRVALTALLSTNGIGLLVAAVGAGIALWATEADSATEALIEHERIVDEIKNTYDATGGAVKRFGEEVVKSIKVTDARKNLRELQEAFKDSIAVFNTVEGQEGGSFATRFFGKNLGRGAAKEMVDEIERLIKKANEGEIEMTDLADEIDKVAENFKDGDEATRRYAEGLVAAATQIKDNAQAVRRAELVIVALTGTLEEQEAALLELNGSLKESAAAQETAAEKAERFDAALKEIQGTIPGVKAELELLEKSKAIESLLLTAIQAAQSWGEVGAAIRAAATAQTSLDNDFASGSIVDRIIGVESGGNPNAKNPQSSATGLGQFIESTWLRLFKKNFPSMASSMTDAAILELRKDAKLSRDMVKLLLQENAAILRQAGQTLSDPNLYLAHFLGPGGAIKLLNSAPGTTANELFPSSVIESNASVLDGKTREQIIAWATRKVGISETELGIQEQVIDLQRKEAEDKRKAAEDAAKEVQDQRQATQDRLADGAFEISQQELINQGKERQAAIEEAVRAARADDPNITQEELQAIRDQTAAVFDLEQAKKNSTTASEKAAEAEKEVNNLLGIRRALEDQLDLARQQGDQDQAENLRLKIGEVNAELLAAIENAKLMWEAVGGSEAQAAIAQLETARIETQNFGQDAANAYLQWERVGDLFVQGLSGAFTTFAKKVAEGESATDAARAAFLQFASDFLLQIAQMILQQAIFNALRSVLGGTGFGAAIGLGHTGGLVGGSRVGSGNGTRRVSPAMFASAPRYHSGGIVGLKPGEVPIIAQQGEEMLTRDDPRHVLNGGGRTETGQEKISVKVINALSSEDLVVEGLSTRRGEQTILNFIRNNRDAVNAELNA